MRRNGGRECGRRASTLDRRARPRRIGIPSASLSVAGSVARVKRRFSAVTGCSARLSWHFRAGADARVAARGQTGGGRHESARRRTRLSGDGGGYQAMRRSTRRPGRTGAADQRRDRTQSRRSPTVAGRGRVRCGEVRSAHPEGRGCRGRGSGETPAPHVPAPTMRHRGPRGSGRARSRGVAGRSDRARSAADDVFSK